MREEFYHFRKGHTECLIDGEKITYDGCSSGELDAAKKFYSDMEYIGSKLCVFH